MQRTPTPRHYLMCRPDFYEVTYEINPWMDVTRGTDTAVAVAQWETLRQTYLDWGHTVDLIDPIAGLPDMVYAANGAMVVDGIVYSAKFRFPERAAEGPAYQKWFADHGYVTHTAAETNEGEGDILMAGDLILGGSGFRTDRAAHRELAELTGHEVITLELVDPRWYHLDTALTALNGTPDQPLIAYYPGAFSPASQAVLRERFPDAIVATERDAMVLGLNSVSDGYHVVVSPMAVDLPAALRTHGFQPVPVDTSELLKGGGGAKCCTLEIRPASEA
jgi:N-dimethylarginine dimethylaminohydrolase